MIAWNSTVRWAFFIVLAVSFVSLTSIKILEWQDEEIGISLSESDKEIIHLPSVTLCIPNEDDANDKTLSDLVIIPPDVYIINSWYLVQQEEKEIAMEAIDPMEWSHSFYMPRRYNSSIWPCYTWNPPFNYITTHQYARIVFEIKHTDGFALELHDIGHSMINFRWSYEQVNYFGKGTYYISYKYKEYRRISTKKFKCDESGNARPFDCLTQFYNKYMNCSLPWTSSSNECNSKEDPIKLKSLVYNLVDPNGTLIDELKSKNCWIPNCTRKQWSRLTSDKNNEVNAISTTIQLTFDTAVPVQLVHETKLYGITNLISDFGAYLGLLLGYSLLSVFQSALECLSRLKCAFSRK